MLRSSLSVGDIVQVDPKHKIGKRDSEGGFGYLGFDEETHSWNVSYPVENNRLSPAISPRRLHPTTMATTGRRRKGDAAIRPSLLSHRPKPKRRLQFLKVKAVAVSKPASKHQRPMATAALMRLAKSHPKTSSILNPAVTYLLKQRKAPAGWLRQVHNELKSQSTESKTACGLSKNMNSFDKPSGNKVQLTESERQLVFGLCNTLDMTIDGVYRSVGHAWGQSYKTMMRIVETALDNEDGTLSHDRMPKANSNETVFESLAKQMQVFTAYYVFKKVKRSGCCLEDPLTCKELRKAWEALPGSEKAEYEYKAEDCRRRAVYLLDDVTAVLQRTRGSVTWRRLASEVAGSNIPIACHETMRKFVMGLPDSAYKTTRMHPKLDESCRYRRYQWAQGFWIFWNSAKLCGASVQVILVHLDEKWFFAIVVRKNNKLVPYLGVEPVHHEIHHKSHIYKEMIAASTAFLPFGNDMERGGDAVKISFERIGRLVAAIKDTFRRVYKKDGSFHYPPILANLLRRKGEMYFRSMEITGSNEGTSKKPKYSLLRFFLDVEIPKLERLAARIESTNGRRAIIRYQMDGAGPHRDSTLLRVLTEAFDKRGWMIKFQPSNSPHTNIKDMCVFPTLSKQVTALQGLSKKSLVLEGEELFRLAKQAWDELPLSTIARSYAGHHQIVNAIAQSKGGDDFLREKGGLHCGIRQAFVACYKSETSSEQCGVRLVDDYDDVPDDILEGKHLKYPKPDVSNLEDKYNSFLSKEELEVLEKYLPKGSDELVSVHQAQLVNLWEKDGEPQTGSEQEKA